MRCDRQHPPPRTLSELHQALSVSCTLLLPPYFPYHVLRPRRPCLYGSFGSTPSFFSPGASLPHLPFARSATPPRPCYSRLALQFAVGENFSTGYGRFLRSLHLRLRLPSQTLTRLPMVSTVIGSTAPLPFQLSSRCSVTATFDSLGWHPTAPSPHLATSPRSRPSVMLSRRIALPQWQMSTPWVLE